MPCRFASDHRHQLQKVGLKSWWNLPMSKRTRPCEVCSWLAPPVTTLAGGAVVYSCCFPALAQGFVAGPACPVKRA